MIMMLTTCMASLVLDSLVCSHQYAVQERITEEMMPEPFSARLSRGTAHSFDVNIVCNEVTHHAYCEFHSVSDPSSFVGCILA
jgi:hypothetical protein